jgi:uncharacterized protein YggE
MAYSPRTRAPYLLLPVLLALAACGQPQGQPRLKPKEVLLQVSAAGRSEVRPDEARITVGVSSTAPAAAAASAANSQTMAQLVTALRAAGVRPEDVQTRNLTLGRIDYGPQKGRYRAENLVDIRLRDVSKAGAAIAAATDAGGNVVAGPQLRVSNPDNADNAAYAAAYKAATLRADTYAKAAGLKVVRVLAIRDGGGAIPPIRYDGYAVEAQAVGNAASAPPVSAGVDVREARVQVDFALAK